MPSSSFRPPCCENFFNYGLFNKGEEELAEEYEDILTGYIDKFFEKYQERLFTEYAATSPSEAIFEVFVFFITGTLEPGTKMRHVKVNFLNTFPELVQIRSQIATTLAELGVLP
jgi:hypothetical protein